MEQAITTDDDIPNSSDEAFARQCVLSSKCITPLPRVTVNLNSVALRSNEEDEVSNRSLTDKLAWSSIQRPSALILLNSVDRAVSMTSLLIIAVVPSKKELLREHLRTAYEDMVNETARNENMHLGEELKTRILILIMKSSSLQLLYSPNTTTEKVDRRIKVQSTKDLFGESEAAKGLCQSSCEKKPTLRILRANRKFKK